jgi:hypothetical protein
MPDLTPADYARAQGIDLFTIPFSPAPATQGQAEIIDGRRLITLFLPRGPLWDFVLLHELAHHELGHTGRWSSTPEWMQEWHADMRALQLFARWHRLHAVALMREQTRARTRAMIQPVLDADITHHGEIHAGLWAGCTIPEHLRVNHG